MQLFSHADVAFWATTISIIRHDCPVECQNGLRTTCNTMSNLVKKVYITFNKQTVREVILKLNKIYGGPAMNPSLHFIFSRRSVRKYESREIPADMYNDLFEAAMAAPSAVAKDPWHFLLITDRKILDTIVKILPNGQMLRQAPATVIVCGDINKAHANEVSYMLQDLSAAVENLLLAATALGLGSCWLGMHPRQDRIDGIRSLFSLPANIIPMCGIALGWPAENPEPRTRFNPERVHLEKW